MTLTVSDGHSHFFSFNFIIICSIVPSSLVLSIYHGILL